MGKSLGDKAIIKTLAAEMTRYKLLYDEKFKQYGKLLKENNRTLETLDEYHRAVQDLHDHLSKFRDYTGSNGYNLLQLQPLQDLFEVEKLEEIKPNELERNTPDSQYKKGDALSFLGKNVTVLGIRFCHKKNMHLYLFNEISEEWSAAQIRNILRINNKEIGHE